MVDRFAQAGSGSGEVHDGPPPLLRQCGVDGMAGDRQSAGCATAKGGARQGFGWVWGLLLLVGLTGLWVLAHFPPDQHGFYPRCSLYSATGLLCPGCGSFRALHALTQGEWLVALRSNLLLTLGLPALALFWLARCRGWGSQRPISVSMGWLGWWVLVGLLLFGLLRNLPGPFSEWLAP
jgi:hypothetical protein